MIGRRCLWGALLAVALWSMGCSDACGDLAQRTCSRVGDADPLCRHLKEIAAEPRAGDAKRCTAGIEFIDELRRGG